MIKATLTIAFSIPLLFVMLCMTAQPALADSTFSALVGEAVMFSSAARQIGGTGQINVGASVGLGHLKLSALKNSAVFDYASGSAGGGSINDWGIGFATRLNTPVYIGAGGLIYVVNVNRGAALGSRSTTGFGSNIFVGQRLFGLPGGTGFSAQMTYRQLPTLNGIDPSGLSFALRVDL